MQRWRHRQTVLPRPCARKPGLPRRPWQGRTADPTALDVLGGGLIDSARTIRAVSDLEGSAGELDRVADETRSEVSAMRRELAPLDSGSSLATAADIELVCERLGAVGIGALTAWSWLAQHAERGGPTLSSPADPTWSTLSSSPIRRAWGRPRRLWLTWPACRAWPCSSAPPISTRSISTRRSQKGSSWLRTVRSTTSSGRRARRPSLREKLAILEERAEQAAVSARYGARS